jgi:hypothetical protein
VAFITRLPTIVASIGFPSPLGSPSMANIRFENLFDT